MSRDFIREAARRFRQRAAEGKPPMSFLEYATKLAELEEEVDLVDPDLATRFKQDNLANSAGSDLSDAIAAWDAMTSIEWASETPPGTEYRRARIHDLLEFDVDTRNVVDTKWPPESASGQDVVLEEDPAEGCWSSWEVASLVGAPASYWSMYKEVLLQSEWQAENINRLSETSSNLVQRLSDPTRGTPCPVRGLVVGYVQSGKTANMLAMTAKAVDAGYRLVIVLAGLTNLLREQTQRRFDLQLVGAENLNPGQPHKPPPEYAGRVDWDRVAQFGLSPTTEMYRLTGLDADYRNLGPAGAVLWDLSPPTGYAHLNDKGALRETPARLAVVKKHSAVLDKLLSSINGMSLKLRNELPVLIIDDESDEASVDTTSPSQKWRITDEDDEQEVERQRTAINSAIVKLLEALPRAAYVGYTATPFANVFVDPSDPEDLFPRDFVVSLERPAGYMGAAAFHDLDGLDERHEDDPANSNEAAFVRDVVGEDSDEQNLLRALDSYVLAGAVKLFRQHSTSHTFPHHTMLIHSSQYVADQEALQHQVRGIMSSAGWHEATGSARLRALYESDFVPVSSARAPEGIGVPSWPELEQFVTEALSRIRTDHVMVVNGQEGNIAPDFDQDDVWAILIGGAKLSRGYTIEGLTVSYFRRRASTGATLMQMGRWFGYRRGYRDLVRLFIGRQEPAPGGKVVDLYEAFEVICRDEEAFRADLRKYDDEERRIRPIEVPPLVASHANWLPPAPKNKMWNAYIVREDWSGRWTEKTRAPAKSTMKRENFELFERLIQHGRALEPPESLHADLLLLGHSDLLEFVEGYAWEPGGATHPLGSQIDFLRENSGEDGLIEDWLLMLPRLVKPQAKITIAGVECHIRIRSRSDVSGRVKVYTEPAHVKAANGIVEGEYPTLAREGRGVLLGYVVAHDKEHRDAIDMGDEIPTIGWALRFPGVERTGRATKFAVRSPVRTAVVDLSDSQHEPNGSESP